MAKILSVAEKPSVAKELAAIIGGQGQMQHRQGFSPYNKCFDISSCAWQEWNNASMTVTSVSGHMMNIDFDEKFKSWQGCPPGDLFTAPIKKRVSKEAEQIERTLHREAKKNNILLLWLDCDMEGENIAYEVIQVCQASNPRLDVYRARFSALIPRDILRTLRQPDRPNPHMNDAVEARQEVDLRIGAAFTRFQTLRIRGNYEGIDGVISYGPCQFPTMGFVIERHMKIEAFRAERFWSIHVEIAAADPDGGPDAMLNCTLKWDRVRLFDRFATLLLYEKCFLVEPGVPQEERGACTCIEASSRPTTNARPIPLNTVELTKRAARFLRMGSEKTMKVAEELYNRGILSYPRTETDFFKEGFDLTTLLREQQGHSLWGSYVDTLLNGKFQEPGSGGHDDQAHPPIHPLKRCELMDLKDNDERGVYELVTRHFLACCSTDARGQISTVKVAMGLPGDTETFNLQGLMVTERTWLEVYKYDKWTGKRIPVIEVGARFMPSQVVMIEGSTTAPEKINESQLIDLMDKKGIGTDATIAQHISTIQARAYVVKDHNGQFSPTQLGLALYEAYNNIGYNLTKPFMRANMEADCQKIARGQMGKGECIKKHLSAMQNCFTKCIENVVKLDESMHKFFGRVVPEDVSNYGVVDQYIMDCPQPCGFNIQLRQSKPKRGSKELIKRVLYCPDCDKTLLVPHSGEINRAMSKKNPGKEVECAICSYQVLSVTAPGKNPWFFCPQCFNNPPPPPDAEESHHGDFRCFQCANENCEMASRTPGADTNIASCADPRCDGMMRVKRISNGGYMIVCTKNNKDDPGCKRKPLWMPKSLKRLVPLKGEYCPDCQAIAGVQVCLLKLQLDPRSVPPGTDEHIQGCPCCSPIWRALNATPMERPVVAPIVDRRQQDHHHHHHHQQQQQQQEQQQQQQQQLLLHWGTQAPPQPSAEVQQQWQPEQPADIAYFEEPPRGVGRGGGGGGGGGNVPGMPPAAPDWPQCWCSEPCAERTVRKEGPNQGKVFYCCNKPQDAQCGYFQFGGDPPPVPKGGGGGFQMGRMGSRGGGHNNNENSYHQNNNSGICAQDNHGYGIGFGGNNNHNIYNSHSYGDPGGGDRKCNCPGNPIAKMFTVRKEGPNQGRQFYKCAGHPPSCDSFEWADEPPRSGGGGGGGHAGPAPDPAPPPGRVKGRSRGRGSGSDGAANSISRSAGPRGHGSSANPWSGADMICMTCQRHGHDSRHCPNK